MHPIRHRSHAVLAVLAAMLALGGATASALAASPTAVTLTTRTYIDEDPHNGPWQNANANPLLCSGGEHFDLPGSYNGFPSIHSGSGLQVQVLAEFDCATGGSVVIKTQVHADFATNTETGTWVILGGSGAYEGLRGWGKASTTAGEDARGVYHDTVMTGFLVP
jgi:hypothetical protein